MEDRIGSALWRALRPHQWAKNLLVFVPLALTPALVRDGERWIAALWAFAAWSVVASAGYLANDLVDVESDRRDPAKRLRPFASGALSVRFGVAVAILLVVVGIGGAAWVTPRAFVLHLIVYLALTLAYSLHLKRLLLVDVLLLAGFYTLRLLAGGAAVGIALTPWLLAFSLFLFVGLSFVKRYGELRRLAADETVADESWGRAYRVGDLQLVMMLGTTSVYLSVLVLCLYINGAEIAGHYRRVEMLWFLVPLLLYWVSRVWFLAQRGELPGDPVAFAVRDPVSLVTGALMAGVLLIAMGL